MVAIMTATVGSWELRDADARADECSQRECRRLLQQLADARDETGGVRAVEDAVVAGERRCQRVAREHLTA